MNVKDIIALANAGFSAQQIAQLDKAESIDPNVLTGSKDTAGEQGTKGTEDTKDPKEIQGQQTFKQVPPVATPNEDPMAAMFAKIDQLAATVQAAALNKTEQPAQESVDDILASIINPKQDK